MYVLSNSAVFPIATTQKHFFATCFFLKKTLNVSFFLKVCLNGAFM